MVLQSRPRVFARGDLVLHGRREQPEMKSNVVIVPEDREYPDRRTLRLAVAVESLSETPEPDPLGFVVGGPGGPSVQVSAVRLDSPFWTRFGKKRDIVFFDQRGAVTSCRDTMLEHGIDFSTYNSASPMISPISPRPWTTAAAPCPSNYERRITETTP